MTEPSGSDRSPYPEFPEPTAGPTAESTPDPADRWIVRGVVIGGVLVVALVVIGSVTLLTRIILGSEGDDLETARRRILLETGIDSSSSDIVDPPQRDIRLGVCEPDGDGVRATGTLTNRSSTTADYRAVVSFREGGTGPFGIEYARSEVTVDGVAPGETVNWSSTAEDRPRGSFACRIMSIERTPQ